MVIQQISQISDLAPYACLYPRVDSRLFGDTHNDNRDNRTPFQRDCDRIVHSMAFRLLMHKTQVFVAPVCGQFRTRLTHTIEVARVARALATALHLNPDLAEVVALAHDLGHAPFGHIGEQTLAELMKDHGGFEHNVQAIRIVTDLERSYIGFNGLNLTWDTLEGIAKHNGPINHSIPPLLIDYNSRHDLELDTFPSAEAQVAAVADDIAYNCHDLQDGLRAGLFSSEEIVDLPIVGAALKQVRSAYCDVEDFRIEQTALRRVFGELTEDVFRTSFSRLSGSHIKSVEDVRQAKQKLISFSDDCFHKIKEVRAFLYGRMYRNERINKECREGSRAIQVLFNYYCQNLVELPIERRRDFENSYDNSSKYRAVADYIAGLTDQFALDEYNRLVKA